MDILPSELPREASDAFGGALLPFIDALATEGSPLPPELSSATIASNGELTPAYRYIASIRASQQRSPPPDERTYDPLALEGSTVLSLQGNLFDSGLINAALDVVEHAGGRFDLLSVNVRPNTTSADNQATSVRQKSSALLQLTLDHGRPALEAVIERLRELAVRMPMADATVVELPEHCGGVFDRTISTEPIFTSSAAAAVSSSPTTAAAASSTASSRAATRLRGGGGDAAGGETPQATVGRRLVVLGAGLCAGPAVELLSRSDHDTVSVVSAVPGEAERLCASIGRPNLEPVTLDARPSSAQGWAGVRALLGTADAALSLLPAPMHAPVAEECIAVNTPLVTASYVSPELQALHEKAVAAGVPILAEMGLDPGMVSGPSGLECFCSIRRPLPLLLRILLCCYFHPLPIPTPLSPSAFSPSAHPPHPLLPLPGSHVSCRAHRPSARRRRQSHLLQLRVWWSAGARMRLHHAPRVQIQLVACGCPRRVPQSRTIPRGRGRGVRSCRAPAALCDAP